MIVSTVPYAAEACQDLTPVVPPAAAAARPPRRAKREPRANARARDGCWRRSASQRPGSRRAARSRITAPRGYDMQAQRTVEGTITEYEWGNPHVYLSVRENGSDRVWVVEAFPSTAMKQYGWAADTFARGDRVVVGGNPGRDAARNVLFLQDDPQSRRRRRVVRRGRRRGRGSANKPAEIFRATSLAGTWMTSVGPLFGTFFGPGVAQSRTPQGAAAVAEFRDDARIPASMRAVPAAGLHDPAGFRSIEVRADVVVDSRRGRGRRSRRASRRRDARRRRAERAGPFDRPLGRRHARRRHGAVRAASPRQRRRLAVGRGQASRRAVRAERRKAVSPTASSSKIPIS